MLYAVQKYRNMNSTIPRATIYVGVEPPAAAAPDPRAGALDVGSGPKRKNRSARGQTGFPAG